MKKILFTIFLTLFIIQSGFSQKQLPIIRASTNIAYIRENNILLTEDRWKILPKIKPDIYETSCKKITLYTDLDSITFKIKPKTGYYVDFIILLNRDSAYSRIKYQLSYLNRLKKAQKYNYSDMRFIPQFTYQLMDNPNLVKIRAEFKLDSIAGKGNEVSKILNLMHWIHNTVRHEDNEPPELKNAIDIIKICRSENRGVNCRMLAIILNECYLSMGFKSRYITCMPRETQFEDCHVINMVYSNDLKKWIWVDPTFDAYVMNEKGALLGIDEVRERLIKGKTLIVNPEANWNKLTSYTKEKYLENYMAKNLYRMSTPLVSEYNAETLGKGKEITYVELLPLDGIEQSPQKKESIDGTSGVKSTNYKTNNPNLFWTKPE